ncbi:DUF3021 domain-containing protein, partial [Paucilactobacillus suebicus]
MIKKITTRSLIGAPIGIAIGLTMALIFSYAFGNTRFYPSTPRFVDQFANPINAVTISAIIWALMGVVFSVSSIVFEMEKWSILRQTTVNFIITYIGFTVLALICQWFPLNAAWLTIYTVIYIVVYFFIWFGQLMAARSIVRRINAKIKSGSSSRSTDIK